jgi:hypothetical protein
MISDFKSEVDTLEGWEILGLGIDWKEPVLKFMKKRAKGLGIEKYMRYKTIENLNREYMVIMQSLIKPVTFIPGLKDIDNMQWDKYSVNFLLKMVKSMALPFRVVDLYLRAIWYGAHLGRIPYAKWNPEGYEEKETIRKEYGSEQDILSKRLNLERQRLIKYVTVAGVAVGGFWILNNFIMKKYT